MVETTPLWSCDVIDEISNLTSLQSHFETFQATTITIPIFFVRKSIQVFLSRMLEKDLSKVGFVKNFQGWKFVFLQN